MKKLHGIITAMVTPFDEHEAIDYRAGRNMANWLIAKGVHGLFITGTNGESHLMSDDEIIEFAEVIIDEVRNRVPVVVGAGRCSTRQTIQLAERLAKIGAEYISLITPYYQVPTQAELVAHYRDISDSVDAKFVLYNIPGQTGIEIKPDSLRQLVDSANIVGIKDSGGNFEVQKEYLKIASGKDFLVLNGSDSLMLKAFMAGSVASVAATSNVLPEIEVRLYDAFMANDLEKAQQEREKINVLRMTLKKAVAPSVMKETLNRMGVSAGIPRRPIRPVQSELSEEIDAMIAHYRSLD